MADFPTILDTGQPDDVTDLVDSGQVDNWVRGINRGKDGFVQAFSEVKEWVGMEPPGHSDRVTRELKEDQEVLDRATYDDQKLAGSSGYEFVGEMWPTLAVPFGGSVRSAAALGGVAASGFFYDEGATPSQRLRDVTAGGIFGGVAGKLLLRGGPAKSEALQGIRDVQLRSNEGLFVGHTGYFGGPRGGGGPVLSPQAKAMRAAGLTADDFQLAGREGLPFDGIPPMPARPATAEEYRLAQAKVASFAKKAERRAKQIGRAMNAATGEAKKALQRAYSAALQNKMAASMLSRAINGQPLPRLPKPGDVGVGVGVPRANQVRPLAPQQPALPAPTQRAALTGPARQKALPAPDDTPVLRTPFEPVPAAAKLVNKEATAGVPSAALKGVRAAMKKGTVKEMRSALKANGVPINNKWKKDDYLKTLRALAEDMEENGTAAAKAAGMQAPAPKIKYAEKPVVDPSRQRQAAAELAFLRGKKEGGFVNTEFQGALTGAALGGAAGFGLSEGDPVAGIAGAIGGGAVGMAAARRLSKTLTSEQKAQIRMSEKEAGKAISELSNNAKLGKFTMEALSKARTEIPRVLDQFLGTTMTRLEAIAPRVAVALQNADFQQHFRSGQWIQQGNEWFKKLDELGLTDAQQRKFKIALLNSTKSGKAYLQGIGKDASLIDEFDRIFKEVGSYLGAVDLGGGLRRNYFPRMVIDKNYFSGIEEVDSYLQSLAKKKGIALTDFEQEVALTEVINGALRSGTDNTSFAQAADNLQKRTVKVTDKNVDGYADLQHGFNDYMEQVTMQAERRRFFKGQGVKTDDLGVNAENMDAVATRLKDALVGGDISPERLEEAVQLIKMRFGPGEQAPHKVWQNFKNLTYMGLLGNPISALTQFGDLALSAHRNGIANTASAIVEQLGSRGKAARGLDKEELLGIRNAATDFISKTPTRDALNWSLKYSGFQAVDRFGKNTFIQAAMKKNKQLSPEEFQGKWSKTFDPEGGTARTDELYQKVQAFDSINDQNREDIAFMLWNELSEVQPISLSQMPERYLRHPDGRTAYMLQSFTLKLFDVMRRDIVTEAARGNYGTATKNAARLTTLFVTLNGSVDGAKNFILGRDEALEDVVVNNFLKMAGANKYILSDAQKNGLGQAMIKLAAPPTALLDALVDPKAAIKLTPPFGKLIESRIPDAE